MKSRKKKKIEEKFINFFKQVWQDNYCFGKGGISAYKSLGAPSPINLSKNHCFDLSLLQRFTLIIMMRIKPRTQCNISRYLYRIRALFF